jgi:hypothetical protein
MKLPVFFPATVMFLLFQYPDFAQGPCDESSLMSTRGSWKKRPDANTFPDQSFPKNQFPQVNNRIDKMQKILQAAYPEPRGIEAGWYRDITGNALVSGGPVPFQLTSLFFSYYCDQNAKNAKELGGETGTWFYVWANQLNWFAERVSYYTINKQPVYLLTPRDGELNGLPLYLGIHNKNSNTGIAFCHAQILTRPGQSPFVPVTRKQFLRMILKWHASQLNKTLEAISKSPAEKREQWMDKIKKTEADRIKAAQDYLANGSVEELAQPAIIDDLTEFKQFSTLEKGGQELVRLNAGYFNPSLPKYVPQFLIVYWRWDDNAAGRYFNKQVEEHFDFKALKEMIDK